MRHNNRLQLLKFLYEIIVIWKKKIKFAPKNELSIKIAM